MLPEASSGFTDIDQAPVAVAGRLKFQESRELFAPIGAGTKVPVTRGFHAPKPA